MSLWDNVKKFAAPYGDDDYDDYDEDEDYAEDDYDEPEEKPARRSAPARRSRPAAKAEEPEDDEEDDDSSDFGFGSVSTSTGSTGVTGGSFGGPVLHTASSSNRQEIVLFRPGTFSDTSKAADDLRNRKAVVVNMENVDKALARRVVDFLSGCAYALDGDVKKVAQSVFLFCPHNMEVSGDLETLQAEVENYI